MSGKRADGCVKCHLCPKRGKLLALGRGFQAHVKAVHFPEVSANELADLQQAAIKYSGNEVLSISEEEKKHKIQYSDKGMNEGPPGIIAAKLGDVTTISSLLSSGWLVHETRDQFGSTALHWAAGKGHLEVLKLLLNSSNSSQTSCINSRAAIKVNHRDGRTPLHWAARNGHVECVKYLLTQEGADPNIGTFDNTTPIALALFGNHMDVVNLLFECASHHTQEIKFDSVEYLTQVNDWKCGLAHWACMSGELRPLEWCARHHVPFDGLQNGGHSCFHKAAHRGSISIIRWLVKHLDAQLLPMLLQQDKSSDRPSDVARRRGHLETAALCRELEQNTLELEDESCCQ